MLSPKKDIEKLSDSIDWKKKKESANILLNPDSSDAGKSLTDFLMDIDKDK